MMMIIIITSRSTLPGACLVSSVGTKIDVASSIPVTHAPMIPTAIQRRFFVQNLASSDNGTERLM